MTLDADEEKRAFLEALERGIRLFDEQKFYDAYEVWEARWAEESGEGADLLQGLLQIAVAFAKLTTGESRGASKLLESGAAKLERYIPQAYNLDIQAFLVAVEDCRIKAMGKDKRDSAVDVARLKGGRGE